MKVEKDLPFYIKNQNLIFGLVWLGMGISYLLINFGDRTNLILGIGFCLSGILYLIEFFRKRKKAKEYIIWNEKEVIVSPLFKKEVVYPLGEITHKSISNNHFIIKARGVPGSSVNLKGYRKTDIKTLKNKIHNESVVLPNSSF